MDLLLRRVIAADCAVLQVQESQKYQHSSGLIINRNEYDHYVRPLYAENSNVSLLIFILVVIIRK